MHLLSILTERMEVALSWALRLCRNTNDILTTTTDGRHPRKLACPVGKGSEAATHYKVAVANTSFRLNIQELTVPVT